jgi:hypothetical protein
VSIISIGSENVVSSVLVATGDTVGPPPSLLCRGMEVEGTAVVVAMEVIGRDSRLVRTQAMMGLLPVIEGGDV